MDGEQKMTLGSGDKCKLIHSVMRLKRTHLKRSSTRETLWSCHVISLSASSPMIDDFVHENMYLFQTRNPQLEHGIVLVFPVKKLQLPHPCYAIQSRLFFEPLVEVTRMKIFAFQVKNPLCPSQKMDGYWVN